MGAGLSWLLWYLPTETSTFEFYYHFVTLALSQRID